MGESTRSSSRSPYAGGPANLIQASAFEWPFSQPFSTESDFTPKAHVLAHIEDDRPIFVDQASDRALTFSRLRQDALSLASGLQSLGLDPDDISTLPPTATCRQPQIAPVVLVQLPNCLPFAPIVMGILAAGLTATLVSPALTSKEIAWILRSSRPRAVFTAGQCLGAMQEAIRSVGEVSGGVPVFVVDVAGDRYPAPATGDPAGTSSSSGPEDWKRVLAVPTGGSSLPPVKKPAAFAATQRAAIILWSSGTSGRSKGVLLSHHALNFSAASLWHDADFYQGRHQKWLGYVPFYHVYAFSNIFLLAISSGATVYTMPSFKLDAVLAAIPQRQITYLHMAPPIAVILAKSPAIEQYLRRDAKTGRHGFSSVVAGVTGGAPLGHDIVQQVHRRLGIRVRLGYGLTESCGGITLQRGLAKSDMDAQRGDTGTTHWGVEMMIADPAAEGLSADATGSSQPSTRAAPIITQGEVLVRSPALLMAYLPPPSDNTGPGSSITTTPDMSITSEALTPDGWYRTGDVGTIDKQGRLTITDRIKELIKVKGFQVAPAELEAILCSSESVSDAGVVGIRDEAEATEWPRAYVVPAGGGPSTRSEKELKDLAGRLRGLVETQAASYKWLRGGIVFVEQVPKSPSGKILRRVMRDGGVKGFEVAVYESRRRGAKL